MMMLEDEAFKALARGYLRRHEAHVQRGGSRCGAGFDTSQIGRARQGAWRTASRAPGAAAPGRFGEAAPWGGRLGAPPRAKPLVCGALAAMTVHEIVSDAWAPDGPLRRRIGQSG